LFESGSYAVCSGSFYTIFFAPSEGDKLLLSLALNQDLSIFPSLGELFGFCLDEEYSAVFVFLS